MAKELTIDEVAVKMENALQQLGIQEINADRIKFAMNNCPDSPIVGAWKWQDEYKIKLTIQFQKDRDQYLLANYHATLVPQILVVHSVINGIDTKALEEKMKSADWYYAYSESPQEVEKEFRKIESIESDIEQLIQSRAGLHVATILWNNNVPFYAASKPELIRNYEESGELYLRQKFSGSTHFVQAFKQLTGIKPDSVTINSYVMTEQDLSFVRKQFGNLGLGEAFTESLIAKMKNGEKAIQEPFRKKYDNGDEASAIIYLNKSDKSYKYFLNKWDLSVRKNGEGKDVSMTFYVNDLKRMGHVLKSDAQFVKTFTFKGSVNYLTGRPVENTYMNQRGEQYKAWDQLYPDRIMPNGKMLERTFHPNYGFDLNKVVDEYRSSIKVLAHPDYADRFFQSLRRGNLEATQFVEKSGKIETYLVSPNIQVGFLDVYTRDKTKLTPEQQEEKGFISQAFSQKIKERINQLESERHTHRQSRLAENRVQENRETLIEQKHSESISKSNGQKEKLLTDTKPPKRKLKHKHS